MHPVMLLTLVEMQTFLNSNATVHFIPAPPSLSVFWLQII
jgi:hypothetical protein